MGRNRKQDLIDRETVNQLKENNRTLKRENRNLKEEIEQLKKQLGQNVEQKTESPSGKSKFTPKRVCEKCGSVDLKDLAISPSVGRMLLCSNCKHRKVIKNEKKEEG